jgi:hypothetical protein
MYCGWSTWPAWQLRAEDAQLRFEAMNAIEESQGQG